MAEHKSKFIPVCWGSSSERRGGCAEKGAKPDLLHLCSQQGSVLSCVLLLRNSSHPG